MRAKTDADLELAIKMVETDIQPALSDLSFVPYSKVEENGCHYWTYRRPVSLGIDFPPFDAFDLSFRVVKSRILLTGSIATFSEENIRELLRFYAFEELDTTCSPKRVALRRLERVFFFREKKSNFSVTLPPETTDRIRCAKLLAAEFVACIPQAENWFKCSLLGPNLEQIQVGKYK